MASALRRIKGKLHDNEPMLKSRLFWNAQGFIFLVAVADFTLERLGILSDVGALYFIPVGLFWIPVILLTFSYGLAGSLASSSLLILLYIPNWLFLHAGAGRLQEMGLVAIIAVISSFLGRQVDEKIAAQRRAEAYSQYSVHNQEEVLRRISLDIHDESLQTLMAVCQRLDVLNDSSPPSADLGQIRNSIEQVVRELRDIIGNLRPSILEDLGIVSAVRQLSDGFAARTGIAQELKVTGEEYRLSSDAEIQLFRIAQEVLRNVERHAMAKRVKVTVAFTGKEIRLDIVDDGVGFDTTQLRDGLGARNRYGIIGMRERAESVGGKIEIKSDIGKGTRITALVPGNKKGSP
ncbi:MAG: sensor histidine kinase [Chloroflexi bacterium]|nr:sensor histidine kinase [Chloroflexota bacterium]